MELFIIKIPKNENKIENNKLQSECAKYFVEYLGKNFYHKKFILKKEISGKPYLENNCYNVSIAHSNEIVAILFSKDIIGLDVELIKKRNFKKILSRFKVNIKNPTEIDFYKFWTKFEAEFKSGIKKNVLNFKFENYIFAISSDSEIKPNLYEVDFKTKNIKKSAFIF